MADPSVIPPVAGRQRNTAAIISISAGALGLLIAPYLLGLIALFAGLAGINPRGTGWNAAAFWGILLGLFDLVGALLWQHILLGA